MGAEERGSEERESEEFDEETVDTPALAAVDSRRDFDGAERLRPVPRLADSEPTGNYWAGVKREKPSSTPPSPSHEVSPAGTPDGARAQSPKRARTEAEEE